MDFTGSFDEGEKPLVDKLSDNLLYLCQRIDPIDILIYLRQGRVISREEEDFIQNPYIHVTRQLRAEQMVDVVMQKGVEGMTKFLEVLEYMYPNVFAHVTLKEASNEPALWLRTIVTQPSGVIRRRTSYNVRTTLTLFEEDFNTWCRSQPSVARGGVGVIREQPVNTEVLYDAFLELENENDELRRHITELEQDNVRLKKQKRLHYLNSMKRTQQQEVDARAKLSEIDALKKKVEELTIRYQQTQMGSARSSRNHSARYVQDVMFTTQLQSSNEELEQRCKCYETMMEEIRKEKDELQKECEKLWKQNFESEKQSEEIKERSRYFEREVSLLKEELLKLRAPVSSSAPLAVEPSTTTPHKSSKGDRRPSNTSTASPQKTVAKALLMVSTIAVSPQLPSASSTLPSPAEVNRPPRKRVENVKNYPHLERWKLKDGKNAGPGLSEPIQKFAADRPWSVFINFNDLQVTEAVAVRQDTVDQLLEPYTVSRSFLSKPPDGADVTLPRGLDPNVKIRRKQSVLEVSVSAADLKNEGKITLIGGNYSGIFVHIVRKSVGGVLEVGDQLLQIEWRDPVTNVDKELQLSGVTMDELMTVIAPLSGSVRVQRFPNTIGYKYLMQQVKNSHMFTGDFFCAMFHDSKQHKALGPEFDLMKPSNVLLVMDSRRHGEAMWCGEVLYPDSGGKRAQGVFTSLKYLETDEASQPVTLFDYVTPFRAKAKRPVIIYCAPDYTADIMRALLELSLFEAAAMAETNYSLLEIEQRILNRQILHYESEADRFVCLMTRSLVDLILKQEERHILLHVPVECIRRMYAVGIHPIVFVIKSDQMTSSLQEEVELPEHHNNHQYETIYYPDRQSMRDIARTIERATIAIQQRLIWRQCDTPTSPFCSL